MGVRQDLRWRDGQVIVRGFNPLSPITPLLLTRLHSAVAGSESDILMNAFFYRDFLRLKSPAVLR